MGNEHSCKKLCARLSMDKLTQYSSLSLKKEKVKISMQKLRKARKVSRHKSKKLVDIIFHISSGIPGDWGVFTPIWKALSDTASNYITLTPILKQVIANYKKLLWIVVSCPTSMTQPVLNKPTYLGYYDAYKYGIDGVWTLLGYPPSLWVWCIEFLPDIQFPLISPTNPNGNIMTNDLYKRKQERELDTLAISYLPPPSKSWIITLTPAKMCGQILFLLFL